MERTFELTSYFGFSIVQAETAGWQSLAVECASCATTTYLQLDRLKRSTRFGFFEEIVPRLRCHACGISPANAYLVRPVEKVDPMKELVFRVEEWSSGGRSLSQLMAATMHANIGRAGFDEAVKARPGRVVILRQGARVICSTINEPPPNNVRPLEIRKAVEVTRVLRRQVG
jgi:hypothetical protein